MRPKSLPATGWSLKPLFGAQGKGLRLVASPDELPSAEEAAGVWYLQRYVGRQAGWHDYRVFVVAGRPVAAMARYGTGWITNVRQGAVPMPPRRTGPWRSWPSPRPRRSAPSTPVST